MPHALLGFSLEQRRRLRPSILGGSTPFLCEGFFSPCLGSSLTLCEFPPSVCWSPFPQLHHTPYPSSAATSLLTPTSITTDRLVPLLSRFAANKTVAPAATPIPSSTNQSFLLLLLGSRTLSGDILLSPPATSLPSSSATRPPPEPPPPPKEENQKRSSASPISLLLRSGKLLLPTSHLAPIRPPWKPPWSHHVFWFAGVTGLLASDLLFVATMGISVHVLCFFLFWPKIAFHVFDVSPWRTFGCQCTGLCTLSHYVATVKTVGTATLSKAASNFHLVVVFQVKLASLETIISRNERTLVKDIIRNWIGRKTAESQPLTTSSWKRKLLITWMICYCTWFGHVLIVFNHSKCNGSNAYNHGVVLYLRDVYLRLRVGNVLPHLLHAACIDALVIN